MPRSSKPHVVSRHPFVQQLAEHLHARHHPLDRRAESHNLHFLAHLHLAPLDSPGHHRAASGDRKNILDRHRKRLVHIPLRQGHVLIHRRHQLQNRLLPLLFAVQRAQRRAANHRNGIARELIGLQQLAHFQLHQLQQLGIFHRIALVQKHHDVRHAHLPRQQNVFPRLRHRPIGRRHHQDRPIHLRRPGDHVLDVIGVSRAIDVRVVPVGRLVLHVRHRDGDAPLALFRRVVDRIKGPELHLGVVLRQHLGDRRRQGRLAVIDVTDRPDIHVRLAALELFLRHRLSRSSAAINT